MLRRCEFRYNRYSEIYPSVTHIIEIFNVFFYISRPICINFGMSALHAVMLRNGGFQIDWCNDGTLYIRA